MPCCAQDALIIGSPLPADQPVLPSGPEPRLIEDLPNPEATIRPQLAQGFDFSLWHGIGDLIGEVASRFESGDGAGFHTVVRTNLRREWGGGLTMCSYGSMNREFFSGVPGGGQIGAMPTTLIGINFHRSLETLFNCSKALFQFDFCLASQNVLLLSDLHGQGAGYQWHQSRGFSPGFSFKYPVPLTDFRSKNEVHALDEHAVDFQMGVRPLIFQGVGRDGVLLEMGLTYRLEQMTK